MTDLDSKLDAVLVWDDDGHLADPAVNALADGELALLPAEALAHVEQCERCGERVGQVALFALEVDAALSVGPAVQPVRPSGLQPVAAVSSSRRLPVAPLAIALLTAVLGLLPSLPELARIQRVGATALPLLAQLVARMFTRAPESNLLGTFAWLSTACLLLASAAVARWARPLENRRTP
jgi:hypothetical protein